MNGSVQVRAPRTVDRVKGTLGRCGLAFAGAGTRRP